MPELTRRDLGAAAIGVAMSGAAGNAAAAATPDNKASDEPAALAVPAQLIPVPKSISPEAQTFLAGAHKRIAAMQRAAAAGQPAASGVPDIAQVLEYLRPAAMRFKGKVETIDIGNGAKLYHFEPDGRTGRMAQVAYFDIHGGGFVTGGGEMCLLLSQARAADYGIELYSVDYRLLPAHPYPAPLDDCMAAWRLVLSRHKASDLVIGGSSAGGNLAAAVLLRARDERLPMPAGISLLTPALDMLGEGDSRQTNRFLDVNLYGGDNGVSQYGAGQDQRHPYISPIYGDFGKGWPPTILASGTRDLLLSDSVRLHRALRRLGIPADLLITEAGGHGGFQGRAPEDREILSECLAFMFRVWGMTAET